jgi:hypothetical protein
VEFMGMYFSCSMLMESTHSLSISLGSFQV